MDPKRIDDRSSKLRNLRGTDSDSLSGDPPGAGSAGFVSNRALLRDHARIFWNREGKRPTRRKMLEGCSVTGYFRFPKISGNRGLSHDTMYQGKCLI